MKTPIFSLLSLIMTTIYVVESNYTVCVDNSFTQIIANIFRHGSLAHLFVNLLSFYYLSKIEVDIGSAKFGILMLYLIIFTSFLHLINPFKHCSVGFSGILFGLLTYDYLRKNGHNLKNISIIILLYFMPYTLIPKISHFDHFFGIVAGICWSYLL